MAVIPRGPRASIETTGDSMIITVPTRKDWYLIIFLCWLIYEWLHRFSLFGGPWWGIPAFFAESASAPILFLLVSIPLIYFLYMLCWLLFGKEEIRVTNRAIACNKLVFGIRFAKEYFALHIKNLRLYQNLNNDKHSFFSSGAGHNSGWITFDYEVNTISCIHNVAEVEAREIFSQIVKQFSQYQNPGSAFDTIFETKPAIPANGITFDPLINQSADYFEFLCDNLRRFEKLRTVFNALRDAKHLMSFPSNAAWRDYFDEDAMSHFWWPSEKEFARYKKHWDETPAHLRMTEPSLQKPWMLDSMLASIQQGEYELVNCYLLSETRGRLEFIPNAGPNDGSDELKALIECFGFKVTAKKTHIEKTEQMQVIA